MSETTMNRDGTQPLPVAVPDGANDWKGMTLEDLKRARGKALVRHAV